MKLLRMKKVKDGKYLKNYELVYENKAGKEKVFEIVSRSEIASVDDLGKKTQGVSIIAFYQGKMLLLKEFRMGVNKTIVNFCAGSVEEGEVMEDCLKRELKEETGLNVKRIIKILPPSYAAVSLSDMKNTIAFIEAEGELNSDNAGDNEEIRAAFYSKEECRKLLETYEFSSRCQAVVYLYTMDCLDAIISM